MAFDKLNAQPKLNSQTALAAAVVSGVGLVPFVLATPHHVSTEVVKQVDQPVLTGEEFLTVEEEIVEPPFLLAEPKRPASV